MWDLFTLWRAELGLILLLLLPVMMRWYSYGLVEAIVTGVFDCYRWCQVCDWGLGEFCLDRGLTSISNTINCHKNLRMEKVSYLGLDEAVFTGQQAGVMTFDFVTS